MIDDRATTASAQRNIVSYVLCSELEFHQNPIGLDMKNDIRLAALITLIIGCVFSIPASGFNLSFLEDALIADFSDEDVDLMLDTFDRAMESNKDGEMSRWSNPKSGHGGTITVLETTTRDNQSCRKARIENQIGNSKSRSEFLLCQATNGSWQFTQ